MRRRPAPEPVSARALARLRTGRGGGWVPSRDGLGLEEAAAERVAVRRVAPPEGASDRRVGDGPADGMGADGESGRDAGPAQGRHRRVDVARRWVRAPTAVVGARWQPGRAAVLGVLLVTVLAVLVLGLRVAWARGATGDVVAPARGGDGTVGVAPAATSVDLPSGTSGEAGAPTAVAGAPASGAPPDGPSSSGVLASPGPGDPDGAHVVVHVVGAVVHPGVRRLPAGARVQDAVEAAGGPTRKADLGGLNLARVLVDGEQVRVPRPGEVVPASGPSGPGASGGVGGAGAAPVPLNTAGLDALDALPGIGPVLAQRILDWRTANGRFASVDELAEVSGIGEKVLADLRPLVTV